jgi:hypothetical protein
LSLLLFVVGSGASDIPKVAVEVFPTSLELPAEGFAEATLVVRNPTEQRVQQVRVDHTGLPGVTVGIEPIASQAIPAGGAFAWTLKIGQAGSGTVSGDLNLQVHYTRVDGDGAEFSDVVFTKIAVTSRDQEDASQIVAVIVHTTLTDLNDFRPGYIYLEVENKSDAPVEITDVIVSERPEFILLKPSIDMPPLSARESRIPYGDLAPIPAGESRIFPLYVASGDQVRPGEHMLIFNVLFRRTVNGETQTGSAVAEHKVKVKVFGEEEVLGAIASVTTFLFVPGFLMIVIAGMVWKLFVPGPMKGAFPFSIAASTIADLRFWVIAITFSLLMAWQVYPALSAWLLPIGRRDFLYGYGFQDIIWMWLFSIAIGVVISLLAGVVIWAGRGIAALQEAAEWRRAIKSTDRAMVVLAKIVNQGFDEVRFKEVTVTASGKRGFLLEHEEPGKTEFWIAPAIAIWWHEEDEGLRERAEDQIAEEDTHLRDLLQTLQQGIELGRLEGKGIRNVEWDRQWIKNYNGIDRLVKVNASDLTPGNGGGDIFIHRD